VPLQRARENLTFVIGRWGDFVTFGILNAQQDVPSKPYIHYVYCVAAKDWG